ncbi:unnamed protein product, partial [Thlaspi arvense]
MEISASMTSLAALEPFKTQWRVHVKIIKLWKQFLNGVPTLEMVFVDEKNETMHATVRKELIKKFENSIEEGEPSEELPPHIIGLKSVNFSDIHDGKLNPDFLIDVIGQIVDIGDVEILNVNKKQTKRLTMSLRDLANVRLNCVLWGDYAEELEGVVQNCNEAIVTFVLRFGKLRLYQ